MLLKGEVKSGKRMFYGIMLYEGSYYRLETKRGIN